MNRSHTIREWMKQHTGPVSPIQVRVALGLTRQQANVAMSDMAKAGILTFQGEPGHRVYELARELPGLLTPEQRKEHLAESRRKCRAKRIADGRDEAYRRSKGIRPRAVYLAERKASAKPVVAKPKPAKPAPPKPTAEFRKRLNESVQSAMVIKAKPSVHFAKRELAPAIEPESVAEFLARGGTIDRLPPGAGNSLKFLGVEL